MFPWLILSRITGKISYEQSASSGVRLRTCDYQGIRVLHSAAVPFVHVQYEGSNVGPFTDELRSSSNQIEIRQIMNGFDSARVTIFMDRTISTIISGAFMATASLVLQSSFMAPVRRFLAATHTTSRFALILISVAHRRFFPNQIPNG